MVTRFIQLHGSNPAGRLNATVTVDCFKDLPLFRLMPQYRTVWKPRIGPALRQLGTLHVSVRVRPSEPDV